MFGRVCCGFLWFSPRKASLFRLGSGSRMSAAAKSVWLSQVSGWIRMEDVLVMFYILTS